MIFSHSSRQCLRSSFLGVFALMIGAIGAVWQAPVLRATILGRQQAPAVTFKVDVNFVEIPAVVVDRQGRFVEGLPQGDFEIFEDGKRQTIAFFSAVDTSVERLAVPLVAKQEIEPDVRTNATPFTGRLYVLLMDDLNVDAPNTATARQAAKALLPRSAAWPAAGLRTPARQATLNGKPATPSLRPSGRTSRSTASVHAG